MFKTVKRIIDWCGEFKGRLYAGFVVSFFSHLFTALPIMVAAYTIGLVLQSSMTGTPFDTSWVWKSLVLLLVLVFLRFCSIISAHAFRKPSATSWSPATVWLWATPSNGCRWVISSR